jgi:hypothetical protein
MPFQNKKQMQVPFDYAQGKLSASLRYAQDDRYL